MKSSDAGAFTALILCAGTGSRTGLSYNKLLHYLGQKTVLEYTLDAFSQSVVGALFLAVHPNDEEAVRALSAPYQNVHIVRGGDTRAASVRCGLAAIDEHGGCEVVAIHDGARPFITPQVIDASIESAAKYGSGVVAVPAVDTIKEVKNGEIVGHLPREGLYAVQTPQSFAFSQISDAYARVEGSFTDDSEVFFRAGYTPKIVLGEYGNLKITSPTDLYRGAPAATRIGTGFDVHPLAAGRDLVLGGVKIEHEKGLMGHSDADVLVHAVMDALLSAANLPDIGVLFPDTDDAYKGIASTALLKEVCARIKPYAIGNISAVIMAQKPKMAPHIPAMRETLGRVMGIAAEQINISATTTEHLGIVGKEEGIAASATCLLYE